MGNILNSNLDKVSKIEEKSREERSLSDRIACKITEVCGSIYFIWSHLIAFTSWISFNLFSSHRFDSYPFNFLTFVVSLEAIFLSTFILIGQNQDNKIAEKRQKLDLQVNLLTEQENTKILSILEQLADKMDIKIEDPSVSEFKEMTDLEHISENIK